MVYGRNGKRKESAVPAAKIINIGAAFVNPFTRRCGFLDRTPVSFDVDIEKTLTRENAYIGLRPVYGGALR